MRNIVTFGGQFPTLRATGAENLEAEIRDVPLLRSQKPKLEGLERLQLGQLGLVILGLARFVFGQEVVKGMYTTKEHS